VRVGEGVVRPARTGRHLRDLTRYRTALTVERFREAQRLEKELEDAGTKIRAVGTDILGVCGRAMLTALTGQDDAQVMAEMARGRLRPKIPALVQALTGSFGAHHWFLCRMHLTRIDELSATIEELSARIDQEMRPFAPQVEHLVTIPGVKATAAQVIIAETGADMTRFRTPANLASWAGVCPGHHESAGRQHSGRRRHGNRWLGGALGTAAMAADRTRERHLPRRPLRPSGAPPGQAEDDRRRRAPHPDRRLAHAHRQRRLPRPRRRLPHQTRPRTCDATHHRPGQRPGPDRPLRPHPRRRVGGHGLIFGSVFQAPSGAAAGRVKPLLSTQSVGSIECVPVRHPCGYAARSLTGATTLVLVLAGCAGATAPTLRTPTASIRSATPRPSSLTATGPGRSTPSATVTSTAQSPAAHVPKPAITKAPSSVNASSLHLVPEFIDFPQRRKDEMATYSLRHYGASSWRLNPSMIVLHFTETDTAAAARNGFANDSPNLGELPGTCAHFIVAQNGDVWQIVPTNVRCRHTIGLNDKAIGIEIVQRTQGNSSHWADQQILDRPAQIAAVLALLRSLQRDYGISTFNIIGHATANEAPQFRDLQGWRNDHTDWQAQDVLEVRRRLSTTH